MKILDQIKIHKRILRRNYPITIFERLVINYILRKAIKKDIWLNHIKREQKTKIISVSTSTMSKWTMVLTTDALKMVKTNNCICKALVYDDNYNSLIAYYILDIESGYYIFNFVGRTWCSNQYISEDSKRYIKALFELNVGLRNDGINELLGYYDK